MRMTARPIASITLTDAHWTRHRASPGSDGTLYTSPIMTPCCHFPIELGDEQLDHANLDQAHGFAAGRWAIGCVIIATRSREGDTIYIAVGSVSNIGENGMEVEEGPSDDLGIRYPFEAPIASPCSLPGFAIPMASISALGRVSLWTTVNERDMLGSDLVPDYLTNVPGRGAIWMALGILPRQYRYAGWRRPCRNS